MDRSRRRLLLLFVAALPFCGCDNVGRAWDPILDPGTGGPQTGTSNIQPPPVGGDVRDGRPLVRQTYPRGGGWPTTVPVVVEFSESMNESTLLPTTAGGTDGRLIVRVRGTQQGLPASYDFLANGRLLVVRPTPALSNAQNPTYEVVLRPGARDADGVRFSGDADTVLAEFTVDAPAEQQDGRILALFPRDNQRDVARSTEVTAVFTRPANRTSITSTTFAVRTASGASVAGDIELPLTNLGQVETRVVRFEPAAALPGGVQHQLVVTDGITFGTSGKLDFNGRTPFSRFTTATVPEPLGIEVANPVPGYPDKINRTNLANLQLTVELPGEAQSGDRLVARIYGGDRSTTNPVDLLFFERTAVLAASGAQNVTLDFSGVLGTLDRPKFDDAEIRLLAQLRRGSAQSGFVYGDTSARFDVTPPEIVRVGPPGAATGTTAHTDQEAIAFFATASEEISAATLTDGSTTVALFGSAADGRLLMAPIALGRLQGPRGYSLTMTDLAGNLVAAPITGDIVQRGVLDGAVAGTLTVVAYDDTTLLPIANATIVVDPGAPTIPPGAGRLVAATDAAGRAVFATVAAAHTITIAHPSYHLTTLYSSSAAYASLPCVPRADTAASFRGTAVFTSAPNTTVLVGNNAFADATLLSIQTQSSSPGSIPSTPIRSERPQVITALAGTFEPTAVPTFTANGCNLLGATLTAPSPPTAPAAQGGETNATIALLPATGALVGGLVAPGSEDFGLAVGLDTTNLVGGRPIVRCTMSLAGFPGQTLFGAGFTTPLTGAAYSIQASYSLPIYTGLLRFATAQWLVTEARDTGGRISRHRSFLFAANGLLFDNLDPVSIPVVTAPASSSGPPALDIADVLDPPALPGFGMVDLLVQDGAGRRWTVLLEDSDGSGGSDIVQLPALDGTGAAGLTTGTWTVRATARVFLSFTSAPGNFVLAERLRQEVGMARSATVNVTVQ